VPVSTESRSFCDVIVYPDPLDNYSLIKPMRANTNDYDRKKGKQN